MKYILTQEEYDALEKKGYERGVKDAADETKSQWVLALDTAINPESPLSKFNLGGLPEDTMLDRNFKRLCQEIFTKMRGYR